MSFCSLRKFKINVYIHSLFLVFIIEFITINLYIFYLLFISVTHENRNEIEQTRINLNIRFQHTQTRVDIDTGEKKKDRVVIQRDVKVINNINIYLILSYTELIWFMYESLVQSYTHVVELGLSFCLSFIVSTGLIMAFKSFFVFMVVRSISASITWLGDYVRVP